jgi:hypothetical protein
LSDKCDQQACGVGWQGQNTVLRTLHLAPYTGVHASVGFQNGIASGIDILVVVGDSPDVHDDQGATVGQTSSVPGACDEHYRVQLLDWMRVGKPSWVKVGMDSCVSREDFAKAVAINSGCLTKISGCKTLEEILPQVLGHP